MSKFLVWSAKKDKEKPLVIGGYTYRIVAAYKERSGAAKWVKYLQKQKFKATIRTMTYHDGSNVFVVYQGPPTKKVKIDYGILFAGAKKA
jgi:hypothetical protein